MIKVANPATKSKTTVHRTVTQGEDFQV